MTIRSQTAPEALEFFAGGGLAGLGLAGFEVTFANDIDPMKAAAWRANHGGRLLEGDVWNLATADVPGRPALAWASSPCQDVSLAGARAGLAARRSGAFWGFWRLMQALNAEGRGPPIVVIENVVGLLTSGAGEDFATVCRAMAEAGYRVGALEIDAASWLPQSRPRLFIVAMRGVAGAMAARPEEPFHSARIRTAFAGLDTKTRAAWAWWALPTPARRNLHLADLLDADDVVDWFGADQTSELLALASPLHRERLDAAVASGERRVAAAYRRVRVEAGRKVQRLEMRFDGLAGCLRTPAGGSSRQYVIVAEGGRARARWLTSREAARLMGLPEDYRLPASESAGLKLMGDAVAVPVVRALSEGLLLPAAMGARVAA